MSEEYKNFSIKIIKFLIIFLLIDMVYGSGVKLLFFHQESGKYSRITHTLKSTTDDILIFGDSFANRHYIPDILEKNLDLSCYNAGVQGQQIIFQSAIEKIVLNRYQPEIIILNINPTWLYSTSETYDRLADLNPYYDQYPELIKKKITLNSQYENLKLCLKSYQFNSTLAHMIVFFLKKQNDIKGYVPLYGTVKKLRICKRTNSKIKFKKYNRIDINCKNALIEFIANAKEKNVRLVFITSPSSRYKNRSKNISFKQIKNIAKKHSVPFIDFTNNELFLDQDNLFYDGYHLNNDGAILFSQLVADKIKEEAIVIKTAKRASL